MYLNIGMKRYLWHKFKKPGVISYVFVYIYMLYIHVWIYIIYNYMKNTISRKLYTGRLTVVIYSVWDWAIFIFFLCYFIFY